MGALCFQTCIPESDGFSLGLLVRTFSSGELEEGINIYGWCLSYLPEH